MQFLFTEMYLHVMQKDIGEDQKFMKDQKIFITENF